MHDDVYDPRVIRSLSRGASGMARWGLVGRPLAAAALIVSTCLGCSAPARVDAGVDAYADTPRLDAALGDAFEVVAADSSPAACDRHSATRTAGVELLDALERDLAGLADPAARSARTDRFVQDVSAQGGTPLEGNGEVVFVARGAATWSVGMSTRSWSPDAAPMRMVASTDLYVFRERLDASSSLQYKLVRDGRWVEDLLAQNVEWDGINHNGVGEFNAVAHPAARSVTNGRIVALRSVPSVADADPRDVFVYVPASYDRADCPTVPVIFVHDGNESLTRIPFQASADRAFASGTRPALLAFVGLPSQNVRIDMYTFATSTARGDSYGRFLFDELDPLLQRRFRIRAGRDCRGLSGASLGGLISTYLAYTRSDRVALVGAQSPSYWWESRSLITMMESGPLRDLRIWIDSGDSGPSMDGLFNATAMADMLARRGYDVTRRVQPGAAHDWFFWAERLPDMLAWLLRSGRCDP